MAQKSRRKLLKGLGISIPTVWAAPIIDAVLLPAHAQTTGGCSLPEGCFEVEGIPDRFFKWPGGGGVAENVPFFVKDCDGKPIGFDRVVLAHNIVEAANLLGTNASTLHPSPEGAPDCNFYAEDDVRG